MAKRLYQVWKGRNKFIFSGRLIFGPDARSLILTCLLVTVPVVIFCTHVARKLLREFSSWITGYSVLGFAVLFTIYVLVLLFLTSARDPGIVPRNLHPPEEAICYDTAASVDLGERSTPTPRIPRTKVVVVNGHLTVRVKYCETCMLYRPPRCSHCSTCDNCVERFDHHCPWLGQCIGMRNYRYFFLFISSCALLCLFVFAMSALHIKFLMEIHGTMWKAMRESPASMILMIYCFVFSWFVGGLTCFHLYLIATNQTTYENFRYRGPKSVYDEGCFANFTAIFCTTIKPSRNNFHAYIQEETKQKYSSAPTLSRDVEITNTREKVQDDLEIGGALHKLSQRRECQ